MTSNTDPAGQSSVQLLLRAADDAMGADNYPAAAGHFADAARMLLSRRPELEGVPGEIQLLLRAADDAMGADNYPVAAAHYADAVRMLDSGVTETRPTTSELLAEHSEVKARMGSARWNSRTWTESKKRCAELRAELLSRGVTTDRI